MLLVVHHLSPHLFCGPCSSSLSAQIPHPHHRTSAVVHTAVALSLSGSIRHSYQSTVCCALLTRHVTYWIIPPCVLSITEKAEKCETSVKAGLSLLTCTTLTSPGHWTMLLLPPLSVTHKWAQTSKRFVSQSDVWPLRCSRQANRHAVLLASH